MKYELYFDNNNCVDLPSLTKIQIQGNGNWIHEYMGHVILEGMIWYDLINKTFRISQKTTFIMGKIHLNTLLILKQQVFNIHFHFHNLDASVLAKYIRNMPKRWDENSDPDSDCSIYWEVLMSLTHWNVRMSLDYFILLKITFINSIIPQQRSLVQLTCIY